MTCKRAQADLSAYVDRELTGHASLELRDHLSQCDSCREEYQSLVSLKQFLAEVPTPEPDAFFEDRLVTCVMQRIEHEAQPTPVRWFGSFWRRPAFTFASLAIGSMAVTLFVVQTIDRQRADREAIEANIAFEVQRDQLYVSGSDPLGGVPVINVATDLQR
ncbi:MAG: zf-HC2 domain-containing protein [Fimbriimonadaceae bacterium]|nr:zf-HC2 domain-containing protein [Fimbriimonadaceae bacterium]